MGRDNAHKAESDHSTVHRGSLYLAENKAIQQLLKKGAGSTRYQNKANLKRSAKPDDQTWEVIGRKDLCFFLLNC